MSAPVQPVALKGKAAKFVAYVLAGHTAQAAAQLTLGLQAKPSEAVAASIRWLADPAVRAHLRVGKLAEVDEAKILLFWVDAMDNTAAELKDRLKASELLARSRGMLKDKVEVSGGFTLEQLVPKRKATP